MASEHFFPKSRFPINHPSHGGVGQLLGNCSHISKSIDIIIITNRRKTAAHGKVLILIYLVPGSTLVQKLLGLKFLLFKLLQGKMELVAACRGVILVLGDYPCSPAVRVVLYLSLPGKATCLEAPEKKRKQIS